MPAGLDRVLAVEGDEVVLPAWYTFQGEAAAARPWETLTLMWFLEQEGEDLQQVRRKAPQLSPVGGGGH